MQFPHVAGHNEIFWILEHPGRFVGAIVDSLLHVEIPGDRFGLFRLPDDG